MKKKIKIPKATKGYGYTGVWQDGGVGWHAPDHICGSRKRPEKPFAVREDNEWYGALKGERLFLCEITATPVIDKLGRPITKIVK